jgi:hypothetical protein
MPGGRHLLGGSISSTRQRARPAHRDRNFRPARPERAPISSRSRAAITGMSGPVHTRTPADPTRRPPEGRSARARRPGTLAASRIGAAASKAAPGPRLGFPPASRHPRVGQLAASPRRAVHGSPDAAAPARGSSSSAAPLLADSSIPHAPPARASSVARSRDEGARRPSSRSRRRRAERMPSRDAGAPSAAHQPLQAAPPSRAEKSSASSCRASPFADLAQTARP